MYRNKRTRWQMFILSFHINNHPPKEPSRVLAATVLLAIASNTPHSLPPWGLVFTVLFQVDSYPKNLKGIMKYISSREDLNNYGKI